jgi:HMG (high mobility group) box
MAPKKAAATKKGAVTKTKGKKEKKAKDPNAPKGASGAYIFFCQAHRDEVRKQHPDLGTAQIAKKLGELWKDTPEEDKEVKIVSFPAPRPPPRWRRGTLLLPNFETCLRPGRTHSPCLFEVGELRWEVLSHLSYSNAVMDFTT